MSPDSVLVLASRQDLHALAVVRELSLMGARAIHLDTSGFPAEVGITSRFQGNESQVSLSLPGQRLECSNLMGIWRRRVYRHTPDPDLEPRGRELSEADTHESLTGTLLVLASRGLRVINDPRTETAGLNKVSQLAAAAAAGLTIPATVISNDPAEVARFRESLDGAGKQMICKGFSSAKDVMIPTRLFGPAEMERLESLRLMPAIFQEYAPGRNIRATVVDREVFAAEVLVSTPAAEVDWRLEAYNRVIPFELDASVAARLTSLMARLGLVYGAIDLKLRADGEYLFLEVNPWGQFLFVEVQTGLPISRAIARYLVGAPER